MDDSLKHRLKNSLCCCIPQGTATADDTTSMASDHPYNPHHHHSPTEILHASSNWIKSRSHEFPEFKEKCRNLITRIGHNNRRRRRSQSVDFHYDPLSYALNFDEGDDDRDLDALPEDHHYMPHDFASRLPPAPSPRSRAPDALTESSRPASALPARENTAWR